MSIVSSRRIPHLAHWGQVSALLLQTMTCRATSATGSTDWAMPVVSVSAECPMTCGLLAPCVTGSGGFAPRATSCLSSR